MGDKECDGTQSLVGDQPVIGGAFWGCPLVVVLPGRAAPASSTPTSESPQGDSCQVDFQILSCPQTLT